jgi:hypothetical protein
MEMDSDDSLSDLSEFSDFSDLADITERLWDGTFRAEVPLAVESKGTTCFGVAKALQIVGDIEVWCTEMGVNGKVVM